MSIRSSAHGRLSQCGSSDCEELAGSFSRCSLNPDVAIRLFSGALDPEVLPDLLAGDSPDASVLNGMLGPDEDLTQLTVPEDEPTVHPLEGETLFGRISRDTPFGTFSPPSTAYLTGSSPTPALAIPGTSINPTPAMSLSMSMGSDAAAQLSSSLLRSPSARLAPKVAEAWSTASCYLQSSWQYAVTQRAAAATVLADVGAERVSSGGPMGIEAHMRHLIEEHKLDDTVLLYDLGNVTRMYRGWKAAMPRVTPHYAVKCNPEPALLKLLLALGAGFDCASKAELSAVLSLGAPRSRIIFAHPCKRTSDIAYAAEQHIEYTTFDTVSELEKIAAGNPGFRCVLRIRADDPSARVKLGLKYGADPADAAALLAAAKDMGLHVVGVSFHVGSGARDATTFRSAIAAARAVFDCAELMGHNMELLDIGGGFSGQFDDAGRVDLGAVASAINDALDDAFPEEMGVRIIAEPGRYFAETSATLFTPVYGQRERPAPPPAECIPSLATAPAAPPAASGPIAIALANGTTTATPVDPGPSAAPAPMPAAAPVDASIAAAITPRPHTDYWITDGLYGSFNCILYDDQTPDFRVLRSPLLPPPGPEHEAVGSATVWGPTCDSADCVYRDIPLPHLRNGDWLMWPNAGAYTVAGACDFNGINMTRPRTFFVFSNKAVDGEDEEDDNDGVPPSTGVAATPAGGSSHALSEAGEH